MNETGNGNGSGCARVRGLLEGYFEGALPPRQERLVADHLWQCSGCAAELEQIRRLALALESLPTAEPGGVLLDNILAGLAKLPSPADRRRVLLGWRRVAVTAGLVMAALAAIGYAATLLAPVVASSPALHHLGGAYGKLVAWWMAVWRAVAAAAAATRIILVAAVDVGRVVAPTVGLYAAAELVLITAVTRAIRSRHLHMATSPRVGARRI